MFYSEHSVANIFAMEDLLQPTFLCGEGCLVAYNKSKTDLSRGIGSLLGVTDVYLSP